MSTEEQGDSGARMPRVVAVGSSAGGIVALSGLFADASIGDGLCYVVAQHISPSDKSVLPEILDKVTDLQVVAATDGAALVADVVFVATPGTDVSVHGVQLRVTASAEGHRLAPSIDVLFESVAESLGAEAIAILLSGSGDDGAGGVESVERAGGMVVAQDPTTAAFPEMPGAGIATGAVDLVLFVEDMIAGVLHVLGRRSDAGPDTVAPSAAGLDEITVNGVVAKLLDRTGVDFSGYKRSTLLRQIQRRQRLSGLSVDAYLASIADDPTEARALSANILVGVTSFFRDPSVWITVGEHLATVVDALPDDEQLRIWVPGCATGEEAYTITMIAAQVLTEHGREVRTTLKVFGTDLNEEALTVARRGRYPDAVVASVPDHLRTAWMKRHGPDWEIVPVLRECLVIAWHNVVHDPPFPRLSLISLRNTMIYFQNHLQERVLSLCQFALVPDGLLVLGQSERIPHVNRLFTTVDAVGRVYRRTAIPRQVTLPTGSYLPSTGPSAAVAAVRGVEPPTTLFRRLLATLVPPSLVLDGAEAVVEVVGDVSPWCSVGPGQHTGHVSDLIRERYRIVVRTMLSQLRFSAPGSLARTMYRPGADPVEITATRLVGEGGGTVVSFRARTDRGAPQPPDVDDPAVLSATQTALTDELRATQDALQSTIGDLTASNEDLQALNEELQASAEELQATTEEAQASNEELEATNEELSTLNAEVGLRSDEVQRLNVDLQNIQSSLTSGLVIVDRQFRVTRYTPLSVRLFSLIDEDIGRSLTAVPTTIPVPGLADDLEASAAHRETRLRELSNDRRDLLMQVQPYIGSDDDVHGAIVTVTDVADIAAERRAREAAMHNLDAVIGSVREMVWQRTADGTLTLVTPQVEEMYGVGRESVLAEPGLLLATVHPDDRERVRATWASAEPRWQIDYRVVRPDGSVRGISESARRMSPDGDGPERVNGSSRDVTETWELARRAAHSSAVLEAVSQSEEMGIVVLGADGRVVSANAGVEGILGHAADSLVGSPFSLLLESVAAQDPTGGADLLDEDVQVVVVDGQARWITIDMHAVGDLEPGADTPRTVALIRDMTALRESVARLAHHQQFDPQTGLLTRNYLRTRADEMMANATRGIALLWIDLDGFKLVNDRFGHRAGDIVLSTVASRLHRSARHEDVVGRLGGDEFAMLVSRIDDIDGLDALARRILAAIREPIPMQDSLVYVSASVGIAVHPQDGSTAGELLHNADTAMYVAKQRGRDRHAYFTAAMNEAADERAEMRQKLGAALISNEFVMHYQPVVDVRDGTVAMVEALVRWRRDDGELMTAADFIGYATETGQMRALGRTVLTLVDEGITELQSALGVDRPRVAVNLSAAELDERDIVDWLMVWAPAGGIERIVVEVVESTLLDPASRAMDNLGVLRRLGAIVSIDDFGTGYSNLELLDRLEPGVMKVDRSLVRRAREDERGRKILRAAIEVAKALDAQVVLEGVEDEAMAQLAVDLDADLVQGFHVARPMPIDELIDWIRARA
ncbi:EAL domain-containing protein [Williamsia deligens]|uniref:EAL domain-containing protein n=1 Tax=Williamsia deligens TaxID=321325 RepID=A0ABW3GD73_9NOCA|nr:EAL domain-containing protein [Williamsia deligens]MCP2192468.1 two-component system, chemotaxis family, CheB/CheR fusion protein [Williamsia deligens]